MHNLYDRAGSNSICSPTSCVDDVLFQGWVVAAVMRLAEEDLLCYKPGSLVPACPLAVSSCIRTRLWFERNLDDVDCVGISLFHRNTVCRTSTWADEVY